MTRLRFRRRLAAGSEPGQLFTTQDGVRFHVEKVVINDLEIPWSIVFAPDGRLFVTERHGRVRNHRHRAGRHAQLALTLDDVFTDGEARATRVRPRSVVWLERTRVSVLHRGRAWRAPRQTASSRYRESGNRLAERVVLLDNIPANVIHDGGRLRFGPDGLLYITAGDAATEQMAQDVASLAGKILRINPDGTTPRGNPFSSPVYSYRPSQPAGDRLASGNRRTLGVGTSGATGNDEINVVDSGASTMDGRASKAARRCRRCANR